jgi:hypothetical protein
MDLYITISDENGDVLRDINIYRDGSDSEGADNIINMIREAYADDDDDDYEDDGQPDEMQEWHDFDPDC